MTALAILASFLLAARPAGAPPAPAPDPSAPLPVEKVFLCGAPREEVAQATRSTPRDPESAFVLQRNGAVRFGDWSREAATEFFLTPEGVLSALVVTWSFPEDRGRETPLEPGSTFRSPFGPVARAAFDGGLAAARALWGEPIQEVRDSMRQTSLFETGSAIAVWTLNDDGSLGLRLFCKSLLGQTADIAVNGEGLNYKRLLELLREPTRLEPTDDVWKFRVQGGKVVK